MNTNSSFSSQKIKKAKSSILPLRLERMEDRVNPAGGALLEE